MSVVLVSCHPSAAAWDFLVAPRMLDPRILENLVSHKLNVKSVI